MRVLHLHEDLSLSGGAEVYLKDLLRRQSSRGLQVSLLEIKGLSGRRILKRALKAEVLHLHGVYYRTSPLILYLLSRLRPTLLTLHEVVNFCPRLTMTPPDGGLCLSPAGLHCLRRCGLPGRRAVLADLRRHALKRAVLKRLPLICAPSRFVYNLLRHFGFPRRILKRLPLYLPVPESWHQVSVSPRLPKERLRLAYLGGNSRGKGAFFLREALAELKVPYQLLAPGLWGSRPLPRERLLRLFLSSQVCVMPSLAPESFGLAGLEAAFFGCVVLASCPGGPKDWLTKGGFLFPRGNKEVFIALLTRLFREKELLLKLSSEARDLALSLSDPTTHLKALQTIYETLL